MDLELEFKGNNTLITISIYPTTSFVLVIIILL